MGHERVDRKRRLETLGKGASEVVILAFISLLAGGVTCLVRKNLQLIEQNEDPTRPPFGPRAGLLVAGVPAPSLARDSFHYWVS